MNKFLTIESKWIFNPRHNLVATDDNIIYTIVSSRRQYSEDIIGYKTSSYPTNELYSSDFLTRFTPVLSIEDSALRKLETLFRMSEFHELRLEFISMLMELEI